MTSASSERKFTILDGVVLMAAISVGFGVIRLIWDSIPNPALWATHQDGWGMRISFAAVPCSASLAFPLCVAVAGLGLFGGGNQERRLRRSAGIVACFTVVLVSLVQILLWWNLFFVGIGGVGLFVSAITIDPKDNGLAVIAAWSVLALMGVWKAEPNWLDRAGRCLALYWIVAAVFSAILPLVGG